MSELVAVLTLVQVEVGGEVVDIVSQTSKPVSGTMGVSHEMLDFKKMFAETKELVRAKVLESFIFLKYLEMKYYFRPVS